MKYYGAEGSQLPSAPTDVGTYIVKINVDEGPNYNSATDLTNNNRKFSIAKAASSSDDFDFTAPSNLTYDGSSKSATVTAKPSISGMAPSL